MCVLSIVPCMDTEQRDDKLNEELIKEHEYDSERRERERERGGVEKI